MSTEVNATATNSIALSGNVTAPQLGSEAGVDARNEQADIEHQLSEAIASQTPEPYGADYRPPADAIHDEQSAAQASADTSLDLDAVRAEMAEIRKLYEANDKADSDARKELNETVQERLYKLIGRGIKQARVLMQSENEPALRELVEGTDDKPGIGASLAPTGGGRLVQIASLQIGYRSEKGLTKGKWMVPARRNERMGHIYAVILNKGWSDANCIAKIKELGGFAKVLAANPKRISQASQDAAERRQQLVAKDKAAPVVPFNHGMNAQVGNFRLAVVSIEKDGLRVHDIAPVAIALRNKTCEDFIKTRYEQMLEAEAEAKLAD